jgi:hypothetical protein
MTRPGVLDLSQLPGSYVRGVLPARLPSEKPHEWTTLPLARRRRLESEASVCLFPTAFAGPLLVY